MQAAGFVLFSHPVFLLCEKAVGVHTKAFFLRILARIPVVAAMCFFALLLPFFGPINSIIGAFGVAIGMYIIPSVAFLFTYRSSFARQVRPHPCHRISTLTLSISPMSVLAYHARKTQTRPSKWDFRICLFEYVCLDFGCMMILVFQKNSRPWHVSWLCVLLRF